MYRGTYAGFARVNDGSAQAGRLFVSELSRTGGLDVREQEQESESVAWFDDFGPMHDVWIRFERGMQILLGVALLIMLAYCWSMLYVSVVDVIESLVAATGVENSYP